MEPGPGLALEVVEAEFFLKLLMGLLANQPSFLSRHVLNSRSPACRHREDQVHIGRADLLVPRDADGQQRPRSLSACRSGADNP